MPKDLCEESGDGAAGAGRLGCELPPEEPAVRGESEAVTRGRLEMAALQASGELGYRRLTVGLLLARTGVSRTRFYEIFANKGDCYAAAYERLIERLGEEILATGAAEPSWSRGLEQALARMAALVEAEPLIARGLLAEVHLAEDAPLAKRKEVFERLSRAIDLARRENESRHSPPPITAAFILSAIEASVVDALLRKRPEDFGREVPTLVYLALSLYCSEEKATAAYRRLRRVGSP
jgi:AcrR family transcriptional regulator